MTLGHTMKNYKKGNLMHDVITGIIIMAVSIPISMGYSQIAGLPAVYGLYGSVFPIILFALFSTSPQFIFGVDAAPAALVGSALLGMNIQSGSKEALAVVPVITFFVAVWPPPQERHPYPGTSWSERSRKKQPAPPLPSQCSPSRRCRKPHASQAKHP